MNYPRSLPPMHHMHSMLVQQEKRPTYVMHGQPGVPLPQMHPHFENTPTAPRETTTTIKTSSGLRESTSAVKSSARPCWVIVLALVIIGILVFCAIVIPVALLTGESGMYLFQYILF